MTTLARLFFLGAGVSLALFAQNNGGQRAFSVVEASIPEMRAAMDQGRTTSRELVTQYLTRIASTRTSCTPSSP